MEGIITVKENRETYDAMKEWRKNEALKMTKNEKTENKIDQIVDITKSVVGVVGSVVTIALTICPLDGPAGEIAFGAATAAAVQAVESSRNLLKGIFVNKDPGQIAAAIADLQQNVKDITIADRNTAKTSKYEDKKNEQETIKQNIQKAF